MEGNVAALVEVNCETDFVARNSAFASLLPRIARSVAASAGNMGVTHMDADAVAAQPLADGRQVHTNA